MPRKTKHIEPTAGEEAPMSDKRVIPIRVAQRLPIYYRFLCELSNEGVEKVSSSEMGSLIGVTPSQLRQDLSYFGSFGQQGYGYRVDDLCRELVNILGLDRRYKLVLAGAGSFGTALIKYEGFRRRGYQFVAVFDADPNIIGSRAGVLEIQPISALADYLYGHQVDIGVLTVPKDVAQKVCDIMVGQGVKAIWNFAPLRLHTPDDVVVEHLHLSDSLMSLAFRLHVSRMESEA